MIYAPEMNPFFVSFILTASLLAVSAKKLDHRFGKAFFLMVFLAFIWLSSYIAELAVTGYGTKIVMARIQTSAASLVPIAWINLIQRMYYGDRQRKLLKFLLIIPFMTNVMVWLIPRPNCFWGAPSLIDSTSGITFMDYDYGFWFYYIQNAYSFILLFVVAFLLSMKVRDVSAHYRIQAAGMITAVMLPVAAALYYMFRCSGPSAVNINYTSALFSVSCLILFWVVFKYNVLDLVPRARHAVVESMGDGVLVFDRLGRLQDINPAGTALTGLGLNEIGKEIGNEGNETTKMMADMLVNMIPRQELRVKDSVTGKDKVYDIKIARMNDAAGHQDGFILTAGDYTEKAGLFDKIYQQSIRDDLTGIYNRRFVFEQGEKEISRILRKPGTHISVMVMDIDKMKKINDLYGHNVGDRLLISFARECGSQIRISDVFGRIGGDEFAVILPETGLKEAQSIAERITAAVNEIYTKTDAGEAVALDVSIGIVCSENLRPDEIRVENMVRLADVLMYKAKKRQSGNIELFTGAI